MGWVNLSKRFEPNFRLKEVLTSGIIFKKETKGKEN